MSAATAPQPLPDPARRLRLLVIHCSATPSGRWLAGPPGSRLHVPATQVIDRWHAQRGFKRTLGARKRFNPTLAAVGYHYVVDLCGTVYTGRHPDEPGAHVAGFNADTLGLCLVGGAERDARYTDKQWRALHVLVGDLTARHGLPLTLPLHPRQGSGVCGHRDLSPDTDGDGRVQRHEWLKTCPGFDVGAWLGRGMAPTAAQVCEAQA